MPQAFCKNIAPYNGKVVYAADVICGQGKAIKYNDDGGMIITSAHVASL
jgi:hypothetical protein